MSGAPVSEGSPPAGAAQLRDPAVAAADFVRHILDLDAEERALQLLALNDLVLAAFDDRLLAGAEPVRAMALALDDLCMRLWRALGGLPRRTGRT